MKRIVVALVGFLALLTTPLAIQAEDKISLSGDFRGRWEGFRFSEDETGSKKASRSRLRYRLRLNAKATVNDYFKVAIRVTTGDTDNRSGNQTLGSPADFGPNEFDLRQAYVTIYPFKHGVLPGQREGAWRFQLGRVSNPFIWKNAPDKLLWDGDIALSGVSTTFNIAASELFRVFFNGGYYVVEESSKDKDPYMLPGQLGLELHGDKIKTGVRGTYYYFDKLTSEFVQRGVDGFEGVTSSGGNIIDGLTGSAEGGALKVGEAQAFVTLKSSESWPITVFGGASNNMTAAVSDSVPGAGKEANAFSVGVETGSKKRVVRVGLVYAHIEANAFPSQFIDSDYLDGFTNRKGLIFFVSRQILANTDLNMTLFSSDAINPDLTNSVKGSERNRLQVDVAVKF